MNPIMNPLWFRSFSVFLLLHSALCADAQQDDGAFDQPITGSDADIALAPGSGLQVNFNGGASSFGIQAMAQPMLGWTKTDLDSTAAMGTEIRNAFFSFHVADRDRGLSMVVRGDMGAIQPLLDAYVDWDSDSGWKVRAGQFRSPLNNREMTFFEGRLAMTRRSALSRNFTQSGREFGVTVQRSFGNADGFQVVPTLAVTSGDGLNSFGSLSNDPDAGGCKVGGRLDVLPFGPLDLTSSLATQPEDEFRMALGLATSYNFGASGPTGESHRVWSMYDSDGADQLPDYLKNVVDLLVRYKGASLMLEYVNTAAYGLQGAVTNSSTGTLLMPTEISTYLVLGSAYNVQLSQVLASGWSGTVRFSQMYPEFSDLNAGSVLQVEDVIGACLTRHIEEQAIKIQLAGEYVSRPDFPEQTGWRVELMTQFSL